MATSRNCSVRRSAKCLRLVPLLLAQGLNVTTLFAQDGVCRSSSCASATQCSSALFNLLISFLLEPRFFAGAKRCSDTNWILIINGFNGVSSWFCALICHRRSRPDCHFDIALVFYCFLRASLTPSHCGLDWVLALMSRNTDTFVVLVPNSIVQVSWHWLTPGPGCCSCGWSVIVRIRLSRTSRDTKARLSPHRKNNTWPASNIAHPSLWHAASCFM